MKSRDYVLYKIDAALMDNRHKKAISDEEFTTVLKMTYKDGRGHFNIDLSRIEKVSDFKKVMQILAESDYKNFDVCADIVREYLTLVFDTVVSLRKEEEPYGDDESKGVVMYCDTLIKRFKSFADAFNKICALDPGKKITLESTVEPPKAKKDSYYIMIFDKAAHKWILQNVFGFSFVFNGFHVGVYKTQDGKAWNATLIGYGVTFGMHEKSKKAAIYSAIDTLKKCNFSPRKMDDAAARFTACAAECNIDISGQTEPPTEPETVETLPEPEPRAVAVFAPISPGERHAAAITPENVVPMVVIWLYIAILQKHLFSVSHTIERCHVPVYGFTRLLYTVTALLLYRVSFSGLLSGLPLFVVPKFKRDHVDALPCMGSGLSALRVLYDVKTVSGLTRLTDCRTRYHDTS